MGHKCDELILTSKNGTQKYYFSPEFPVDAALFANHTFGNWYAFLEQSKAMPLKSIVENAQFVLESVAIEIKEMKLDSTFFQLPADVKTIKSPY